MTTLNLVKFSSAVGLALAAGLSGTAQAWDYADQSSLVIEYRVGAPRYDAGFYYYDVTPAPRVVVREYETRFAPPRREWCRDERHEHRHDDRFDHRHGHGRHERYEDGDHRPHRHDIERTRVEYSGYIYQPPAIVGYRSRW